MSKPNIVLTALCIFLGLAAVWQVPTDAAPTINGLKTGWEHLALTTEGPDFTTQKVSQQINKLGNEGWQLVDVETHVENGSTSKAIYFFKREKSAE